MSHMAGSGVTVDLQPYTGSWPDDDPDANFKREVAEYTRNDPLPTLRQLAATTGIPLDALVRYVLVKWTSEGSEALLAMGPRMIQRLNAVCDRAEAENTIEARLRAYDQLRQMLAWLNLPLEPL
jgi:Family of unknown function (DUF6027)